MDSIDSVENTTQRELHYNETMSVYSKGICITILMWIICIGGMFFCVNNHIEKKDLRLYRQICNQIDSVFDGHDSYVDVAYSGNRVEYTATKIPAKPSLLHDKQFADIEKRMVKDWQNDYGDLFKMYHIKWSSKEWDNPWDNADGWNLMELKSDYDNQGKRRLYACWYFPYAVGYKKQDYAWGYDYLPSVQSAVNEAFEFFTTNSKSTFIENFDKGCVDRIFAAIESNEYYFLKKNEHTDFWPGGISITEGHTGKGPVRATYMYNGYYKVFIAKSLFTSWTVSKWNDNIIEEEKSSLTKKWGLAITGVASLIILILIFLLVKNNKKKKQPLKAKLLNLCNPQQFMTPYNKEKVEISNKLFQELNTIPEEEHELLIDFADRASTVLGVTVIDFDKLNQLREMVNPKRFMNPYNAEKINLANELFAKLNESNISLKEFYDIENKATQLL